MFFVQRCPLDSELKLLPSSGALWTGTLLEGKPIHVESGLVLLCLCFSSWKKSGGDRPRVAAPGLGASGAQAFSPWFPPKGRQSFMIS